MLSCLCSFRSVFARSALALTGAALALLLGTPTLQARPSAPQKRVRSTAAGTQSPERTVQGESRRLARTVKRRNQARRLPRPTRPLESMQTLATELLRTPLPLAPPPTVAPVIPSGSEVASPTAPQKRSSPVERLSVLASDRLPSEKIQLKPVLSGFAEEGEGHSASYDLQAGRCYALVAVGEPTMQQLFAFLWDPNHERQQTIRGKREPWTTIRARSSGPHKFVVRPAGGAGQYAAAVYSHPCLDDPPRKP